MDLISSASNYWTQSQVKELWVSDSRQLTRDSQKFTRIKHVFIKFNSQSQLPQGRFCFNYSRERQVLGEWLGCTEESEFNKIWKPSLEANGLRLRKYLCVNKKCKHSDEPDVGKQDFNQDDIEKIKGHLLLLNSKLAKKIEEMKEEIESLEKVENALER